jgi:hypothetical protein
VGNASTGTVTVTVEQDTTAPTASPTVTATAGSIYNSGGINYLQGATVAFTPNDGTGTGSGSIGYYISASATFPTVASGDWIACTEDQNITNAAFPAVATASSVYLHLKDNLGNRSSINLDGSNQWLNDNTGATSSPVVNASPGVLFENGSIRYLQGGTLRFTPDDGSGSGTVSYEISTNGTSSGSWTSCTEGAESSGIALPSLATPSRLYLHLLDNVGIVSTIDLGGADTYTLDNTAPVDPVMVFDPDTGEFYPGTGTTYYTTGGSIDFTNVNDLTSSDAGSDLAGYNIDGGTSGSGTITVNGGDTETIYAVDNVGNASTGTVTVTVEQDTTPSMIFIGGGSTVNTESENSTTTTSRNYRGSSTIGNYMESTPEELSTVVEPVEEPTSFATEQPANVSRLTTETQPTSTRRTYNRVQRDYSQVVDRIVEETTEELPLTDEESQVEVPMDQVETPLAFSMITEESEEAMDRQVDSQQQQNNEESSPQNERFPWQRKEVFIPLIVNNQSKKLDIVFEQ